MFNKSPNVVQLLQVINHCLGSPSLSLKFRKNQGTDPVTLAWRFWSFMCMACYRATFYENASFPIRVPSTIEETTKGGGWGRMEEFGGRIYILLIFTFSSRTSPTVFQRHHGKVEF